MRKSKAAPTAERRARWRRGSFDVTGSGDGDKRPRRKAEAEALEVEAADNIAERDRGRQDGRRVTADDGQAEAGVREVEGQ